MTKQESAVAFHAQGCNCAQSVLLSMTDRTGLPEELAASLATGFGGGAGCRELCGALSGAFMAVGAVLGAGSRPQIMAAEREITEAFREKFGALRCEDLKARRVPCDDLIAFAAEKTEAVLSRLPQKTERE